MSMSTSAPIITLTPEVMPLGDGTQLIRLKCSMKQARQLLEAKGYNVVEISEASASSENDRLFTMVRVEAAQSSAVELWRPRVNEVYCMDALMLLRAIPDASIDLIVTSPPYDNLRSYKGYTWDFEAIAHEAYRVLKTGGVMVWVVGDSFFNGSESLTSMRQALYFVDNVGFNMHQRIIWEKEGLPTKRPNAYLPDFEDNFVLSKGFPNTFNPVMKKNKTAGTTRRKQSHGVDGIKYGNGHVTINEYSILTNVWKVFTGSSHITSDKIAFEHPAMFPEALAERHILTWSNPGDTVLDFFGGSGTTAKMARINNRNWITCDISQEYVDLMKRRLAMPFTAFMFMEAI